MIKSASIAFALALGLASARSAPAEDPPVSPAEPAARDYSGRVHMHSVSMDVEVPASQDKEILAPRNVLGVAPGRNMDVPVEAPLILSTPLPPPPAPRVRKKSSAQQNWLLPSALNVKTEKEIAEQEQRAPGWGWLADEVKTRTEARELEEGKLENEEDESSGNTPSDTARGLMAEEAADRSMDSLVLEEVSGRDPQNINGEEGLARGMDFPAAQTETGAGLWGARLSALMEERSMNPRNEASAIEQRTGWRSPRKEPSSLLPRTQELFSRPSVQVPETAPPAADVSGAAQGPATRFPPDGSNPARLDPAGSGGAPDAKFGFSQGPAFSGLGRLGDVAPSVKQQGFSRGPVAPPVFGAPSLSFPSSRGFEAGSLPASPLRPWGAPQPSASGAWLRPETEPR